MVAVTTRSVPFSSLAFCWPSMWLAALLVAISSFSFSSSVAPCPPAAAAVVAAAAAAVALAADPADVLIVFRASVSPA